MKTPRLLLRSSALAAFVSLILLSPAALAAEISWTPAVVIDDPTDILNPAGGLLYLAADFNNPDGTAAGDDNMINGVLFTGTAAAGDGELMTTTMNNGPSYGAGVFYTGPATGDGDLDAMLDSHSWRGGNPATVSYTLNRLSPGHIYQVQLIAVADGRECCASRTYEPDDGAGNFDTGVSVARGAFSSIVGTFVADGSTQAIGWRSVDDATGNNDPGLSGMVVFRVESTNDADADGLSDEWESANGLNPNLGDSDNNGTLDGVEDGDTDGLDNLAEQAAGTLPNNADTDDDGYGDAVENNSGEWDSVTETGTDPLDPDTDNDTLKDGVENPDLPYVDENQTGSDPNVVDTDGDGLADQIEVSIMLNPNNVDTDDDGTEDGDEDEDEDGSTNINEVANGTGIADPDSDDDMLLDGVETNSGAWFSVSDTGTNPLVADTDGDGLLDGVENPDLPYDPGNAAAQPGTDPNNADSDGDLVVDGLEITEGSDPTDPNDKPAIPIVTLIGGLLGGDLTDPDDDGVEGETLAGPPQTAGSNFDWLGITASSEEYFSGFGDSEGAFDIFDNKVGGGEAKWCCGGPPQNATVEFETPVSLTHFTITSGNDTPDRDPRDFQIQGSNDGVEFTPIYTRADDTVIWTARNQTARIDLAQASEAYKFIRYEVTRTVAGHQISEIEYFGSVGAPERIRITAISYDEDTDMITLTWTSKPGHQYTILYDTDLDGFESDVSDDFDASAEETTTESFLNRLPGEPRVYFIVRDNELTAP